MQTVKPSLKLKYQHYDFQIVVFGDQKLSLTVIDSVARKQYFERQLILTHIGCNTLIKACENNKKEIRLQISSKVQSQNQLIQITIFVESAFLKPVAETLILKKIRDISQSQSLRKAIEDLNIKVKSIRQESNINSLITYAGTILEQKSFASQSTYQTIASIKLPKGKYLLTLNLLLKATNQWAYIYFRQGQSLMTNCGFYMPSSQHYIPHTFRKVFNAATDNQSVHFTTYCAVSYPIHVRNAIITAKKLSQ